MLVGSINCIDGVTVKLASDSVLPSRRRFGIGAGIGRGPDITGRQLIVLVK